MLHDIVMKGYEEALRRFEGFVTDIGLKSEQVNVIARMEPASHKIKGIDIGYQSRQGRNADLTPFIDNFGFKKSTVIYDAVDPYGRPVAAKMTRKSVLGSDVSHVIVYNTSFEYKPSDDAELVAMLGRKADIYHSKHHLEGRNYELMLESTYDFNHLGFSYRFGNNLDDEMKKIHNAFFRYDGIFLDQDYVMDAVKELKDPFKGDNLFQAIIDAIFTKPEYRVHSTSIKVSKPL